MNSNSICGTFETYFLEPKFVLLAFETLENRLLDDMQEDKLLGSDESDDTTSASHLV